LPRIAPAANAAHLARRSAPGAPEPHADSVVALPGAAFVTLHVRGALRGCIGHLDPDAPLGDIVARCAVAAATSDPRFRQLRAPELDDLHIELSLLGPVEPVSSIELIEVGRHGVVVEQGRRRGLLLPQVATEWGWDAVRFVCETCRKAGLPMDAWRHGASMFRFEAEVFAEERRRGGESG
jgi:AmmeMemoRadiSam system protein A